MSTMTRNTIKGITVLLAMALLMGGCAHRNSRPGMCGRKKGSASRARGGFGLYHPSAHGRFATSFPAAERG